MATVDPEKEFHRIAATIAGASEGKMFGALAIKAPNGKAAVLVKSGVMAFKLRGDRLHEVLALEGAAVFAPADGRPMNGWVQLGPEHAAKWETLAREAVEYVASL